MSNFLKFALFLNLFTLARSNLELPELPDEHYLYFFSNNLNYYDEFCLKQQVPIHACNLAKKKGFKSWGYEENINLSQRAYHVKPVCYKHNYDRGKTLDDKKQIFYDEADFGYIKQRKFELKTYCEPKSSDQDAASKLECTDYLRFCKAKNLFIDFKNLNNITEPMRYRGDVLDENQIGGWDCKLNKLALKKQAGHKSPLQSWYEEIEHYILLNETTKCDIVLKKPTYILKIDATVNMYHHFCDFVNLYLTNHFINDFSLNNNILIWDTYTYRSNFGLMWNIFTKNKLRNLNEFKGKKVCFKNAILPFLPRMIFGLYYNMPLIAGCERSGFFHAFNRHVIKRLNISLINKEEEEKKIIRITFLSRSTPYRKVLNEDELIQVIRNISSNYEVKKIDFNHKMNFLEQVKISSNTDILIGMHGAGLTHCLFMPDWSVLFELYNCEDENCYKDLARLRGIKYLTWQNKSKLTFEHLSNMQDKNVNTHSPKFTNYFFDKSEFKYIVEKAINHVKQKKYKKLLNKKSKELNSVKIEL